MLLSYLRLRLFFNYILIVGIVKKKKKKKKKTDTGFAITGIVEPPLTISSLLLN